MVSSNQKFRLWLELILVFGLLPLVCWLGELPITLVLLIAAGLTGLSLAKDPTFDRRCFKSIPRDGLIWRRMLLGWVGATLVLMGFIWLFTPSCLFDLPLGRTKLWLLIMVAYPLVSVAPQEIVYRVYFCHRYAPLFGNKAPMVLASAVAFGFAHIVFGNWVAVVLTVAGGWLFARTYIRTKSLPCVFVQHALFGATIFSIGLGGHFIQGTMQFVETFLNRMGN